MNSQQQVLVIDNGSFMIKAGFADSDAPEAITVPPVVTTPPLPPPPRVSPPAEDVPASVFDFPTSVVFGEEAVRRAPVNLRYIIGNGDISDTSEIEKLWAHVFDKMKVNKEECPVLFTETPFSSLTSRETITKIMFNEFKVPSFYLANEAILSLNASGRTTGVVFNSGDSMSYIVPIQDGCPLPHATARLDFAGSHLTKLLMEMLNERGHKFHAEQRREIREMKEKVCYVALDFENEMKTPTSSLEKSYKLLNGEVITVASERFRCPEALFKPGVEIHKVIYNTIMKCDEEIQGNLFAHIVLSGGSTMFHGLAERLQKEIAALVPDSTKVRVIALPERENAAWIGGCILASLDGYRDRWISKQEYEESGPSIVHRKCPKV